MVAAFAPGIAVVGGRIVTRFQGERPAWLTGYEAPANLADYGTEPFEMSIDRLPIGANMGFVGDVLRARLPEPFDPRLGHTGCVGIGYEEFHLALELMREHEIMYAPDACVDHWVDGARCTYPAVRKSFYQLGFGIARSQRIAGQPLPSYPRRVVRLIRTYRGALALSRSNARLAQIDAASAEREFWGFLWAGLHAELVLGRVPRLADWFAGVVPGHEPDRRAGTAGG
jgi:hypothetical protein